MTYPPPGGTPDPYQQNPYGQQPDPYGQQQYGGQQYQDPYAQPQPGSPAAYGAQAPYGQQQPYAVARGTNTMAILSLVFAFVFSPVGIVLGHMAKKQIAQTGEEGDGLATAGLVLSYIFTGLFVLGCCGYLVVVIGLFGAAGAASTGY